MLFGDICLAIIDFKVLTEKCARLKQFFINFINSQYSI